jgi:hypothetical protein
LLEVDDKECLRNVKTICINVIFIKWIIILNNFNTLCIINQMFTQNNKIEQINSIIFICFVLKKYKCFVNSSKIIKK